MSSDSLKPSADCSTAVIPRFAARKRGHPADCENAFTSGIGRERSAGSLDCALLIPAHFARGQSRCARDDSIFLRSIFRGPEGPRFHRYLLQLGVFGFGGQQRGEIGIGVFPLRE